MIENNACPVSLNPVPESNTNATAGDAGESRKPSVSNPKLFWLAAEKPAPEPDATPGSSVPFRFHPDLDSIGHFHPPVL